MVRAGDAQFASEQPPTSYWLRHNLLLWPACALGKDAFEIDGAETDEAHPIEAWWFACVLFRFEGRCWAAKEERGRGAQGSCKSSSKTEGLQIVTMFELF
jgi:hypothetical protein